MSDVSLIEMQGRLTAAIVQRNDALDRCVLMQGTIAALQEELRATQAKIPVEVPA